MEDTINVHGHGLVNVLWMTYIALDQGHMTSINVVLDEGNIAAGEVIDDHDCVTPRNQPVNEMRPDEACATGDQGSHGLTTKTARIREMVPAHLPGIGLKSVDDFRSGPEEQDSGEVNT